MKDFINYIFLCMKGKTAHFEIISPTLIIKGTKWKTVEKDDDI